MSDPHLAAPFFAPGPALRGSLTPHLHVSSVRSHSASSLSVAERSRRVIASRHRLDLAGCQVSAGNLRSVTVSAHSL